MGRRLLVNPVTRIEGHAQITLDINDAGHIASGHLQVQEIRGFEKLVEGMELFKMPVFTARLCGVCPAAHHLASVVAIENGLGIKIPDEARKLRALLYAGHILHSHALSNFLLAGPDVLMGINSPASSRNVFGMLGKDPETAKKALRLRTIGQRIVELVGGRGVHPVTMAPGGMASQPDQEKLELISLWGSEAYELLTEVWSVYSQQLYKLNPIREATILPHHHMALSNNGMHSFVDGDWVVMDSAGTIERAFKAADYAANLIEHIMPGSYMKSVRLRGTEEKSFYVSPLARLKINKTISTPKAQALLDDFKLRTAQNVSILDFIEARHIEMIHAAELINEIAGAGIGNGEIRVDASPKEGRYIGAVEAPRGLLVHDYTADSEGRIVAANLIVATQNNYDSIDNAIASIAGHFLPKQDDDLLMNGVEFAMRCFDPCLACATHAAGRMPMEISIRRGGEIVRTLSRRSEQ